MTYLDYGFLVHWNEEQVGKINQELGAGNIDQLVWCGAWAALILTSET